MSINNNNNNNGFVYLKALYKSVIIIINAHLTALCEAEVSAAKTTSQQCMMLTTE